MLGRNILPYFRSILPYFKSILPYFTHINFFFPQFDNKKRGNNRNKASENKIKTFFSSYETLNTLTACRIPAVSSFVSFDMIDCIAERSPSDPIVSCMVLHTEGLRLVLECVPQVDEVRVSPG